MFAGGASLTISRFQWNGPDHAFPVISKNETFQSYIFICTSIKYLLLFESNMDIQIFALKIDGEIILTWLP